MPKSEFNDELVVQGGVVQASGTVNADTTARAAKSDADVDVHWVVAQGDLVAHGHVHADLDLNTFKQADHEGAQTWKAGPAQVSGFTVTVALEPRPAHLETFEWHQEVQLKIT